MTESTNQQGIILVSQDFSLTALITGYCEGRHIRLVTLDTYNAAISSMSLSSCQLVIFDARRVSWPADYFAFNNMNSGNPLRVLVIFNTVKPVLPPDVGRVSFVKESELFYELNTYFSENSAQTIQKERRVRDRRQLNDRRSSGNHNGSDRSANGSARSKYVLKSGEYEINYKIKAVLRNGKDLHLTRKEFELFAFLMSEHTEICSIDTILKQLWPNTKRANKSDLYQYIHTLRKKLEDDPCTPKCLLTVKGVGYQLRL